MSMRKKNVKTSLCPTAITCHSYNADRSRVALSASTPDIYIYEVEGSDSSKWKLVETLSAHDMNVTSIDWGTKKDRIVSCSEDRTAFVWEKVKGKWDQALVVLGPNCTYGGLDVKWSPNEEKFVVGTGSSQAHVCYYDAGHNWWLSKGAKGHSSSCITTAWMPGGDLVIATGSTDCRVIITSGYIRTVDGKVANPGKVGTKLGTIQLGGWVHCVNFSPSGDILCAVTHDSAISFIDTSDTTYEKVQTIYLKTLPFNSCVFLDDDTLIAGGNDFYPVCFKSNGKEWKMAGKWVEGGAKPLEKTASAASRAMNMFQQQAKFGDSQGAKKTTNTKHQSAIMDIKKVKDDTFSTSGADGQLNIWKMSDMQAES